MAAADFKTQMEAKLGHSFYFHSIVSTGSSTSLTCDPAATGKQYLSLADMTGGQKLDICTSDWTMLFAKLADAVAASAPLPCDFAIPTPPNGETLDVNAVRVVFTPAGTTKSEFPKASSSDQCSDKLGWYYGAQQRITFCPKACDLVKSGGSLSIGFGCAPQPLQ
jgi:hypothetical protein